jgi:hypothetical protein
VIAWCNWKKSTGNGKQQRKGKTAKEGENQGGEVFQGQITGTFPLRLYKGVCITLRARTSHCRDEGQQVAWPRLVFSERTLRLT